MLAQTASYVIHKENVDLATEVNDGTHAGADLGNDETISDEAMLESLLNFTDTRKLKWYIVPQKQRATATQGEETKTQ